MMCPRCNVMLSVSDRDGVQIDACLQCGGGWLDRGDLEKLIALAHREFEEHEPSRIKRKRKSRFKSLRAWFRG